MKTPALLALLVSFLLGCALPAAPETDVSVSVEFTVIGWAGDVTDLGYKTNGRLHPIEAPGYARSKTYEYSGPAKMAIYRRKAATDDGKVFTEKKDADIPVATVTFQPGTHRYTLLLASQNGACQADAVADDPERFPPGSVRLLNLCPVRMALRCNQTTALLLPSRQNEIVQPRNDHVLLIESAYERDGQWIKASDDYVPARPTEQTSVFFLASQDRRFVSSDGVTRTIQMVIFREKPPENAQAQSPLPRA